MITLPAVIRKHFGIKVGDDVGFIKINGDYKIVPLKSMHELVDHNHLESTKKLIEEMRNDRLKDR